MSNAATEIAERIDAALAEGVVPWSKPWIGGHSVARNLKSKRAYRGINVLLLALSPHAGQWWVTYKQAAELGGNVRKGEKGTRLFFWKDWCPQTKGGDARRCSVPGHTRKDHPLVMKAFTVFNVETQCEGDKLLSKVPPHAEHERNTEGAVDIGLALVDALNYVIDVYEAGDQAFYRPSTDDITLPPTDLFVDGRRYYWVALHELVHSTGHETRLARLKEGAVFGSKDYAREELVAEIGSCIAATELGFEPAIDQSAAYIDGWRQAIADDPQLVTIAAQRAAKAVDLLFAPDADDPGEE